MDLLIKLVMKLEKVAAGLFLGGMFLFLLARDSNSWLLILAACMVYVGVSLMIARSAANSEDLLKNYIDNRLENLESSMDGRSKGLESRITDNTLKEYLDDSLKKIKASADNRLEDLESKLTDLESKIEETEII